MIIIISQLVRTMALLRYALGVAIGDKFWIFEAMALKFNISSLRGVALNQLVRAPNKPNNCESGGDNNNDSSNASRQVLHYLLPVYTIVIHFVNLFKVAYYCDVLRKMATWSFRYKSYFNCRWYRRYRYIMFFTDTAVLLNYYDQWRWRTWRLR